MAKEPKARVRKRPPIAPPKPPKKQLEKETEEPQLTVERFDKAFFVALGYIAILTLLFFIPIIGPVLILTIIPYFACYRGGKYVSKRNGVQVGFLVGIIWASVETALLFEIIKLFGGISFIEPGIYTSFDFGLIILIFILNIIFCTIGGYVGGKKINYPLNPKQNNKF